MSLIQELRRRNVFRVGAAYLVLSWLLLQIGDVLFDALGLGDSAIRLVVGLLVLGFVPVVVFSWAYELTPEGVKRESEVDRSRSITHQTGRKLDYITIGMVVAGLLIVLGERYLFPQVPVPATSVAEVASEDGAAVATPATPAPAEASIAVLPFADMSPGGDQAYFADGIAEEILNVLVRIDDLKVASRTSSFAYRGRDENVGRIAEELKVRNILEGSVRKSGDRLRITAQLIDAVDDRHLWSETFDRDMDDIFAIQDEIATAIVDALAVELGTAGGEGGRLVTASTDNLSAYDLFLKGREMFIARDRLGEAIEIMQQAVALDPGFARAWEILAALLSVSPSWGLDDLGDRESYHSLADEAANRALALDETRYLALAIRGQNLANRYPVRWEQVIELHDRAIQINPRDATLFLWRGIIYRVLGFHDQAYRDFEICLDIDPAYENCRNNRFFNDLDVGDVDAAVDWLDRSLKQLSVRHDVLYPFLVPDFVRRGEIRTAYLLADGPSWDLNGDSRPIHWWIEGLLDPEGDHGDRIQNLVHWSESTSLSVNSLVWASLGAWEKIPVDFGLRQVMWRHDLADFRKSDQFKQLMRDFGTHGYWVRNGFPPRCRDLGEGDFACD